MFHPVESGPQTPGLRVSPKIPIFVTWLHAQEISDTTGQNPNQSMFYIILTCIILYNNYLLIQRSPGNCEVRTPRSMVPLPGCPLDFPPYTESLDSKRLAASPGVYPTF